MADFSKSVSAIDYVKSLMHPPRTPSSQMYKASDAFAPFADKNIAVGATQADRALADPNGKLKGGALFSMLGEVDPAYKGKTWGFDSSGHATGLLNAYGRHPADALLMSTILGSERMHGSNSEVFARQVKAYRAAMNQNKLTPEHRELTNKVLREMTDKPVAKGGVNLFDPDADVTDPAFWRNLTTFNQRRAMNDVMGGIGVGGPKSGGAIYDWQKIMDKTSEPMLKGVQTRSIGPRVWAADGSKEFSPHLNKAYPDIIGGSDLGINFEPVPFNLFLKDYTDSFIQNKNRIPNWKNLTMGDPKSQMITDQWLQHLKNQGYAEGGEVDGEVEHMQAGGLKKAAGLILPELENAIAGIGTAGRSPIVPMPNRWFLNPDKHPHQQAMVERVLERTGRPRESFTSGAFVDPRTGEVLDHKILEDVGVAINPHTNRPSMSAGNEAGIEALDKELGALTRSNLVRKGLFKREGGDSLLDDINFLATIERSGMGHKYGLSTEYGSPTLLHNTGKSGNPTLRPTSRGDVFGMGDVVGQVRLGQGIPHDVYEKLFVAPAGMDVQGIKLHKADGGVVHAQFGGAMGTLERIAAMKAANEAAKLSRTRKVIPSISEMTLSQAERDANLAKYLEGAAVKDRMYHATGDDFTVVDVNKSDPRSKFGTGFYMTPNTNYANFFGNMRSKQGKPSQVMPVYSSVKNPYEISGTQNIPFNGIDREKLQALGHDGVLFRNDAGKVQEVVAFEPTQVKSAIGNRGTYDPTEAEMTKRGGGVVHAQDGGFQGGGYPYPRGYINYPTSQDEHSRNKGLPAEFYRMGQVNPSQASMSAGVGVPMGGGAMTVDALAGRTATAQGNFGGMQGMSVGYEHPVGQGTLRGEMVLPMQDGSLQKPANYNVSFRQRFAEGGQVTGQADVAPQSQWWQDMLDNSLAGGHIDDLTHSLGKAYFEKEHG